MKDFRKSIGIAIGAMRILMNKMGLMITSTFGDALCVDTRIAFPRQISMKMKMISEMLRNSVKGESAMARISARLIGHHFCKNAHEVNLMLEEIGFLQRGKGVTLKGSPTWDITELGKLHGSPSQHPYSSGYVWDQDVIDILKAAFKL